MNEPHLTSVATGISYGALANDQHARIAVERALQKMPTQTVASVLLFMTTGYAHNPNNAIKLAAKTAGTPQVFGCCSVGLLTEEDWLLDGEGAVAMVFPPGYRLQAEKVIAHQGLAANQLLTLCSPNAATIAVNEYDVPQVGAICSDDFGHGPFSIWQSGRIEENEYCHLTFPPELAHTTAVSEGVTRLSPVMQINRAEGHTLVEIDQLQALDNLLANIPQNLHAVGLKQPYNLLCAVSENNAAESINSGHYKLQHIVSSNEKERRIHLSGSVKAGRHMFWALRDEEYAKKVIRQRLEQARNSIGENPAFALMFPNIGRGPEFFNGRDCDLDAFNAVFPGTPLIGFYGNGEIAPGHKLAGLIHHYSTVFAVYK